MGGLEERVRIERFVQVLDPRYFQDSPAITLNNPEALGFGNKSVAFKTDLHYATNPEIGARPVVALVKEGGSLGSRNVAGGIGHETFLFMPDGSRIVLHDGVSYAVILSAFMNDYHPLAKLKKISRAYDDEILALTIKAAQGIQALHRAGLAYVDHKKENLFVRTDLTDIKIGDFDATMLINIGDPQIPLRYSDTWPTEDGVMPCAVTYTTDTVAFGNLVLEVLNPDKRPAKDLRKRIKELQQNKSSTFEIDELIDILESPHKERRAFIKKAAATIFAAAVGTYVVHRISDNNQVYRRSKNYWLDNPAFTKEWQQGLALAFAREKGDQVESGEIPSDPVLIDAVPGRRTRYGNNLGIESFHYDGGAYASFLFAAARLDPRVLPGALAHATALKQNTLGLEPFVLHSDRNLNSVEALREAYNYTSDSSYMKAALKIMHHLASRAYEKEGYTIVPYVRRDKFDDRTFQSADADALELLLQEEKIKQLVISDNISLSVTEQTWFEPNYRELTKRLCRTLKPLVRDGVGRMSGGIENGVVVQSRSIIAADSTRLMNAFRHAGELLDDQELTSLSHTMLQTMLAYRTPGITNSRVPRYYWHQGPLDMRAAVDTFLAAKEARLPQGAYHELLSNIVFGVHNGTIGGVPPVEIVAGFKNTRVLIKRKEIVSGASTTPFVRAWQNVSTHAMELSYFRALTT